MGRLDVFDYRVWQLVQPEPAWPHPPQEGIPASARRSPPLDEKIATVEIRRSVCTEPQSGQRVSLSRSDIDLRAVNAFWQWVQ